MVMAEVQGQWRASRSQRRRPVETSRAAAENSRSRKRLGSNLRVSPGSAHRHPGQQFEADLDAFQPGLVLGGVVQGKVAQLGVAGCADAVLGAGALAVPQFQGRDRGAACVRCEAGDPHAVRR